MKNEIKNELLNHIVPFWNKLRDDENGGFYGYVGDDLEVDKNSPKGVILHSRILWFYSALYSMFPDKAHLDYAKHAYEFLRDRALDPIYGGVYWSLDASGKPLDVMKHIYCQAFFVYAMSEYYLARGDGEAVEALKLALRVFSVIEEKGRDETAYLEAMSREWVETANDALSENGLSADKTMNTVLHLIEAYTVLYSALLTAKAEKFPKTVLENVEEKLIFLLKLTYDKIYDPTENKLFVFFDRNMRVIGDINSYGHDIEATWLIDRAVDVLKANEANNEHSGLFAKLAEMNSKIVKNIAEKAYDGKALFNERDKTEISKKRIWWVEAEGAVGFLNAYKRYGNPKYREISENLWRYIRDYVVDKRPGGEWHSELGENGESLRLPVAGPWKCPYHNGRMCLEIIKMSVGADNNE